MQMLYYISLPLPCTIQLCGVIISLAYCERHRKQKFWFLQEISQMAVNTVIQAVYEQVLRRNAGEVEFQQAVKEVLDSLGPVLEKHP